jgi:phage terminase small subunit
MSSISTKKPESSLDPITESRYRPLTGKQKKFADLYIGVCCLNATRAAIEAGYSERTAREIASQNLRKPEIRRYIDERIDASVLTAVEVLSILSDQARASIADVLNDDGSFDFEDVKRRGADRLIKEFEINEELDKDGKPVSRKYKVRIHDAQAAAEKIGRFHKLFTDKREISGSISTYSMTKEEWERDAAQKLEAIEQQFAKFESDATR